MLDFYSWPDTVLRIEEKLVQAAQSSTGHRIDRLSHHRNGEFIPIYVVRGASGELLNFGNFANLHVWAQHRKCIGADGDTFLKQIPTCFYNDPNGGDCWKDYEGEEELLKQIASQVVFGDECGVLRDGEIQRFSIGDWHVIFTTALKHFTTEYSSDVEGADEEARIDASGGFMTCCVHVRIEKDGTIARECESDNWVTCNVPGFEQRGVLRIRAAALDAMVGLMASVTNCKQLDRPSG